MVSVSGSFTSSATLLRSCRASESGKKSQRGDCAIKSRNRWFHWFSPQAWGCEFRGDSEGYLMERKRLPALAKVAINGRAVVGLVAALVYAECGSDGC
jgi:hypothetical protein